MPNWKKLIVSGSDATLNSLNVTTNGTFGSGAIFPNVPADNNIKFVNSAATGHSKLEIQDNSNNLLAFISSSGNVGIGTATSAQKLRVQGNLRVSSGYALVVNDASPNEFMYFQPTDKSILLSVTSSNTTYDPQFIIRQDGDAKAQFGWDDDGGKELFIVNASDGPIQFKNSTSEHARITNAGDVGIGTTVPQKKLDIAGGDIRLDNSKSIFFATTDANIGRVAITGDESGDFIQLKVDNSNTHLLKLDTTGVGIGTSSPAQKLHVYSAGTAMIRVDSDSTSPYKAGIEFIRNSVNGGRIYNDGGAVQVKIESDYGYEAANPSRGGFQFKTAPATSGTLVDAVRIDALGKVGIGTASPGVPLHIYAAESTMKFQSSHGRESSINQGGGNFHLHAAHGSGVAINYGNTSHPGLLKLYNNTTSKVQVNANGDSYFNGGKVGIGTTSPTDKVEIYSNGADVALRIHEDAGTHQAKLHLRRGGSDWEIINNNDLSIEGEGTERLIIKTSSGNVGIGSSTPVYLLDVAGDIGTDRYIRHNDDTNTYFGFSGEDTIQFNTNSSERLRISSTGNVGIGTDNPGAKLDIVGTVRVDQMNRYTYLNDTNDHSSYSNGTQDLSMPLNGYLWHDLLGFDYNYTKTQEISTNGSSFSSHTLDKALFSQKQDQSIAVIATGEKAVRWTFQGVSWSSASHMNIAFSYVSSDISKDILIESSTDGSSWTTRHTSTVSAGISTKSCYISPYSGDSYLRLTITKNPTSSTNVVNLSSIRLMTARAGDQGQGMEYQFPYTWDHDRRIAIGHTPTSGVYEASLAIKGKTADTTAYSLIIRNSSNTSLLSVRNDGRVDIPSGAVIMSGDVTVGGNLTVQGTTTTLNTATVEVEDNILQLNTTQGTPDTATATTSGISVYRGDGVTQASLIFDDADDTWDLTNNLNVGGDITLSQSSVNLDGNGATIFDNTNNNNAWYIRNGGSNSATLQFGLGSPGQNIKHTFSGDGAVEFDGNGTFGGAVNIEDTMSLTDGGTVRGKLLLNASDRDNVELRAESLGSTMKFFTVGTEALLLDASQNATFSGKININQSADDQGLQIKGYDDQSGSNVTLRVNSAGHATLSQTTDGSSGYLFLQAENYLQLIAGSFIYTTSTFRIYDNTELQFGNSGDYKIKHNTGNDNLIIHTDDNKGITIDNAGTVTLTNSLAVTGGVNDNIDASANTRKFYLGTGDAGGSFLIGKIEHSSNTNGAISATCHFAYDYGSSTNNCTLHFNFAQRSGTARGTWWYEGDDQEGSADRVHARLIDTGGDMYVWITCVDFAAVLVESKNRFAVSVPDSGPLTAATLTSGTTLFDTADNPTAEMHVGNLFTNNVTAGDASTSAKFKAFHSDGSYTEQSGVGLTLSRSNSYIQSTADNTTTLNIGQSSVRWGHVKVDAADFAVFNGGNERFKINSSGNATFAGDVNLTLSSTTQRALSSTGTNSMQIGDAGTQKLRFKNAAGISLDIAANGNATFIGTIGSGAITSTGKISGTEIEGTSLDINGNADIGGNLTLSSGGNIFGTTGVFVIQQNAGAQLDIKSNQGVRLYIDKNNDDTSHKFEILSNTDTYASGNVVASVDQSGNAIFAGKVGIGMTPVEVLDLKAASGDTRIRLDAASGNDTEIKFFNAGVAQYTVGHDDGTDNFVIGGANVDAPLVSIGKTGNTTFAGTVDVNGTEITVGTNNSIFAENNIRFKSSGAAFIDHNTTSQSIKFRLSNSSALDVTPLEITPTYLAVDGDLYVSNKIIHSGDSNTYLQFPSTNDKIVFATNGSDALTLDATGKTTLHGYGSGTFTGTVAKTLAVDSSGNIIETDGGGAGTIDGSGTAGFIPKWSGSDGLEDSILEQSSNIVHLGTTSSTANYLFVRGSNSNDTYNILKGSRKYPRIELVDTYGGGSNLFQIWNLGNELRFGSSCGGSNQAAFYIKGGGAAPVIFNNKIGIGTLASSPSSLLDVRAADGVAVDTYVGSIRNEEATAGDNFGLKVQAGSNTADASLEIASSGGTSYLRVRGDGNVGIGTNSPSKKFVVKSPGADNGIFLLRNSTSGIIANVIETGSGDGALLLATNAAATSVLLRGSGNNYINSGNVGIGTTLPSTARLVVHSGGSDPQILVKNTAGTNAKILFEDNSGGTQNASITYDQGSQNTLTIATGYQSANDLNRINIAPAGNVGLTVRGGTGSNNGNVGIGTTTPISPLHILGASAAAGTTVTIDNGFGESPKTLNFTHAATTSVAKLIGYGRNNSSILPYFAIEVNNTTTSATSTSTTERMRIISTGEVGINTTPTAGYNLDVKRTTPGYSIVGRHATGGKVGIYNSTGDNGIGTVNNYAFNLFTNNSAPQVTLTTAGNIGIGTVSPAQKLTVQGNIQLNHTSGNSQSSYDLRFNATNSSGVSQIKAAMYAEPYGNNTNGGNLVVKTANTSATLIERFSINAIGAARLNQYGSGTHTGTAAKTLQVDSNGNIIEGAVVSFAPKVEYQTVASDIAANATFTLPNSLSYTVSSGGYEYLEVFLDGIRLNRGIDFEEISTTSIKVLMSIPAASVITYKSLTQI